MACARARGGDQVCKQPDDPTLFVLSINCDCPSDISATAMGFAVLQGQSIHAALIYPRIEAVAQRDPQCQDCLLLGSAMAHELAHLIFRSARHSELTIQARGIDVYVKKGGRWQVVAAQATRVAQP